MAETNDFINPEQWSSIELLKHTYREVVELKRQINEVLAMRLDLERRLILTEERIAGMEKLKQEVNKNVAIWMGLTTLAMSIIQFIINLNK